MLGLIDLYEDQPEDADARFRAALEIFRRSSDLSALALLLQDFSMVARLRGEVATHLKLGGASDALAKKTGTGLAGNTSDFIDLDLPARPTGDPEGERCWDEGLALTTQQALELALGDGAADAAPGEIG
jgi:hypothetical protein